MKILFSNYAILDKEGFARSFMLAKELTANGHEVTFLTTLPANSYYFPCKIEYRDGVKIIAFFDIISNSFRRTGFGFLSFIFRLIYIFTKKFDIYHSDVGHRPSGGVAILIKKFFFNIIYVTEWYNFYGRGGQYDSKRFLKKITHGFYDLLFEIIDKKMANGVVCLSNNMKCRALENNISINKLCVINGGSDVKLIPYNKKSVFRDKLLIPKSKKFIFGFIGMSDNQLNEIIPFVEAINELKDDNCINDILFITTGGKLSESIKRKFKINFDIMEFGWVDYEIYGQILNSIDYFVFLQSSKLDNQVRWPNRIGDYSASGRKTIINPMGETIKFIEDYPELFIKVDYDKQSVKEIILKIISENFVYKDRNKIRKISENEISWNNKANELINFYDKLNNDK